MEFYEIDTKGKLWIERLSSMPTWSSSYKGRIVYDTTNNIYYYGGASAWIGLNFWSTIASSGCTSVTATPNATLTLVAGTGITITTNNSTKTITITGGIPASTKMLFYQDTAPSGWTIVTTIDDALVYFTKGSAAGGNTGGATKTSSTWTQPNHTHTTGWHALTEVEMPYHTHYVSAHTHLCATTNGVRYGGYEPGGAGSSYSWGYDYGAQAPPTDSGGAGYTTYAGGWNGHNHGATDGYATASTWRPLGYCVIICTKN